MNTRTDGFGSALGETQPLFVRASPQCLLAGDTFVKSDAPPVGDEPDYAEATWGQCASNRSPRWNCPNGYRVVYLNYSSQAQSWNGAVCRKSATPITVEPNLPEQTPVELEVPEEVPAETPTEMAPAPVAVAEPPMESSEPISENGGCMPDDAWEAMPQCIEFFQSMPEACKREEGPLPEDRAMCVEYHNAGPHPVCSEYAALRIMGMPQVAMVELFNLPSCSGKSRSPEEVKRLVSAAMGGNGKSNRLLLYGALGLAGLGVGYAIYRSTRR